jgi:hypothetical protein
MQGDSSFRTQSGGMSDTDMSKIRSLISEFVGDQRIGDFLGNAIERAFGNALSANAGLFGDASMPYGSTSIFGAQNAGANVTNWMQDQSVSGAMKASSEEVERLRQAQNEKYLLAFGAAKTQAEAEALSDKFTMTGLASNFMFNQLQPKGLQLGMEEGIRYMGAGGIGLDADQLRTRTAASKMTEALTTDFLSKPGDYSGLKGSDVGRLFAEMGRTGQLSRIREESGDDPAQMQDRVIQETQRAAQSIQSFRQIFRGSVTDVLDQVNALMGMDVASTFEDKGRGLFQRMSSAGMATGFTSQQMTALGGMSRVVSTQAGLDSWGSVANATFTAQLLGVTRHGGAVSPLVAQPRYRQDVLTRVTGAQQSGMARDISGAYSLVTQRSGKEAADTWLRDIRGRADLGSMTADDIAETVRNSTAATQEAGVEDTLSGFDLRSASFGEAAEKARAEGVGGRAALLSNAQNIQTLRMSMAQRVLGQRGFDAQKITQFQEALKGKALTEKNLRDAASASGMGEAGSIAVGSMMRRFGTQASELKMGGARYVDQFLASALDSNRLGNIIGQTELGAGLMETLSASGAQGGVVGFNKLIAEVSKGGSDKNELTMRAIFEAVTGKDAADLDITELQQGITPISSNLTKLLKSDPTDAAGRSKKEMATIGANSALRALLTGQIDGKMMTQKQLKQARDALGKGDVDSLINFATQSTDDKRKLSILKNAGSIRTLLGDGAGKVESSDIEENADAMTLMEEASKLPMDDFVSKELKDDDTKRKVFQDTTKNLLAGYRKYLKKQGKEGDPDISFDTFRSKWFGAGKRGMDEEEYSKLMEAEDKDNDSIGSGGPEGMGGIIEMLKRIFDLIEDKVP